MNTVQSLLAAHLSSVSVRAGLRCRNENEIKQSHIQQDEEYACFTFKKYTACFAKKRTFNKLTQ